MNDPIRVMVCDDSSTMRRLIKKAVCKDLRFSVVYEAKDGRDAVDSVAKSLPHIIVMDVDMPNMNGIEATRLIKKANPELPIVMFSALTSRGAEATLDAMAAGANDFALKPTASGHIHDALELLGATLIPKLTSLTSNLASVCDHESSEFYAESPTPENFNKYVDHDFRAIAIGASTGGPEALLELIAELPKKLSVPILIVQHMPPVFTTRLAERLSAQTQHDVREAKDGEPIIAGRIYIAPGDYHLTVHRLEHQKQIRVSQEAPINSCRPAVDPLFQSAAEAYGSGLMGIVLSGTGTDGVQGCLQIKSSGGVVMVQDEASSVIWGMPGEVVEAGLADEVLNLKELAGEIKLACDNSNSETPHAESIGTPSN